MSDYHPPRLVLALVEEPVSYPVAVLRPLIYPLALNSQADPVLVVPRLYRRRNNMQPVHHGVLPPASQYPALDAAHLLVPAHPSAADPVLQ